MTTLPIALAAAALAVGLASTAEAAMSVRLTGAAPIVHQAGCYDECEDYLEAIEEAREEAREAREEAREAAAEEAEEYGYRPRRAKRRARKAQPAVIVERAEPTKSADSTDDSDNTKTPVEKSDVAANAPGGCKQYFPATGITLSVPCE